MSSQQGRQNVPFLITLFRLLSPEYAAIFGDTSPAGEQRWVLATRDGRYSFDVVVSPSSVGGAENAKCRRCILHAVMFSTVMEALQRGLDIDYLEWEFEPCLAATACINSSAGAATSTKSSEG